MAQIEITGVVSGNKRTMPKEDFLMCIESVIKKDGVDVPCLMIRAKDGSQQNVSETMDEVLLQLKS